MGDNKEVKVGDLFRVDETSESIANRREPKFEPKQEPELESKSPKRRTIRNSKEKKSGWKKVLIVIGSLIVLGLIGWGVYSYIELSKLQNPEYAEQQAEEETQALIEKVGRLMELPDGEPVVATVSDKSKLADQLFFAKAENGDKVIIFAESSVAIIYRESTDKIINSGPIAIMADEEVEGTTTEEIQQ